MARKKVVPPVTPRIVSAHPGRPLLVYGLLFGAFLLTLWFSYDYGKTQAPTGGEAPPAQSRAAEKHMAELELERDALKQQVAELESSVQQINQALGAAQARIRTLQRATASTPAAQPVSEPTPLVTHVADYTLQLENVRIEPTDSENVFTIGFSVHRTNPAGGRVTGTIWIAVNGFLNGEPKRLSFKTLSSDRRSYVRMGFDQQQDVVESVVLPTDFRPKNILVEAKPYGDKYTGTAVKLAWE